MARKSGFRLVAIAGVLVALGTVAASVLAAVDRSAIWKIVRDRCVPHFQSTGDPAPCASMNLENGQEGGSAVLKDLVGHTQYLLVPTRRVSGIDSPDLSGPGTKDWFAQAWAARRFMFARLHKDLPRDEIGLAINAPERVSQDQLHIHVDCISRSTHEALARSANDKQSWQVVISGSTYNASYVASEDLANIDIFDVAAKNDPNQNATIRTIVVVGRSSGEGPNGFILLVGVGHGEDLLDHSCAIAN
jgi:CDP-diacylglycerol pyrophosphatase